MTWNPIERSDLEARVSRDLADCSDEQKQLFSRLRVPPLKWKLSPPGDVGGGFWVLAIHGDSVLWFNDIEDGFNVSRYKVAGEIPPDEYWCNQDPLRLALARLVGDANHRVGGSQPTGGATKMW